MNRFEEIVAWQKARQLAAEIYRFSQQERLRKDFELRDQMVRAAISIMANIAEGFEARQTLGVSSIPVGLESLVRRTAITSVCGSGRRLSDCGRV
jgi:hypothetical protein